MTNSSDAIRPLLLTPDVLRGVYVIVPAYNEGECIETVVRELSAGFPNVVVVDDGSSDNTSSAARRGGGLVLWHIVNRGQGAALQTGMDFALGRGAQYVVTFDADGQHQSEDIAALLDPIVRGECDITLGSRFLGGAADVPVSRRLLLRVAVLFTRIFNRVRVTDAHNGLRAFSRRAAERIDLRLDRMAHASELLDQVRASGLAFREIPVRIRYTPYSMRKGQSARGAIRIVIHYLLGRIFP